MPDKFRPESSGDIQAVTAQICEVSGSARTHRIHSRINRKLLVRLIRDSEDYSHHLKHAGGATIMEVTRALYPSFYLFGGSLLDDIWI